MRHLGISGQTPLHREIICGAVGLPPQVAVEGGLVSGTAAPRDTDPLNAQVYPFARFDPSAQAQPRLSGPASDTPP